MCGSWGDDRCVGGHLVEDHPGLVVIDLLAVAWDHRPVGPYRLQAWSTVPFGGPPIIGTFLDLDAALRAFAIRLPAWPDFATSVIDETFTPILTVARSPISDAQLGHACWYGVAAAFQALVAGGHAPAEDVAVWESIALHTARTTVT